ncbi:hypothetical protein QYF36_021166 [Acer negundo]|nr:hypothetical protein QYF36_021166 [Acer negundo]
MQLMQVDGVHAKAEVKDPLRGVMIMTREAKRLGKKVHLKCNDDDKIDDLKKLVTVQMGTRPDKIRIHKWYTV